MKFTAIMLMCMTIGAYARVLEYAPAPAPSSAYAPAPSFAYAPAPSSAYGYNTDMVTQDGGVELGRSLDGAMIDCTHRKMLSFVDLSGLRDVCNPKK